LLTDHDSRVLARKTFRCRAWDLGSALDWAVERATARGLLGVTVSCEPTGHRWRVLGRLAAERGMPFVCVQPMLSSWARRSEDLTVDKTDEKDAVLIARLTAQLRCYVPEPVDETWARLRHLGARREQLITEMVSQVQQMRALLECVWPAALDTARQPFRSKTWAAAMSVICERDGGDLERTRRLGPARFEQAVRREILKHGGQKPSRRIAGNLFAALTDPTGVTAHRPGALERVAFLLADWRAAGDKLADTEARMTAILDELKLTSWPPPSPASHRWVPQRSWPRPVSRTDSRPAAPWSSTPASRRGKSCPARMSGAPNSPVPADPDYASRRGAPCGAPNAATPSMPPATGT
jgi:transposase